MFFGTFALLFGLAAILFIMTVMAFDGMRGSGASFMASLFSGLIWSVLALQTFNIEIGGEVYIEWIVAYVYYGLMITSWIFTLVNGLLFLRPRTGGKDE